MRLLLVLVLALAGQALPSLAATGGGLRTVLTRTPIAVGRLTASLGHEQLVAVTWRSGSPAVSYRWHQAAGWTSWQRAEQDTADSPQGTPGTTPLWRPRTADRVALSVSGRAAGLQLVRIEERRARGTAMAHAATGTALLGPVHSRADWGADESLRRGHPTYAARVDAVVVHHTADANGYQPADVPALIRADYDYHVRTRGWLDLGYNLLVDQFGGIWEGRAGGLGRATIGAHAEGFNTGTLGVAVIGDLTKTGLTEPAGRALAHVIAYAASTWRFDPTGSVVLASGGSPRFPRGQRVTLHRVFGHGETGITECPGSVEDQLDALRALAKVGLGPAPAVTRVSVTGTPVHTPRPMTIDADLTRPAAWSVRVLSASGDVAAVASGTGTAPHLSWNGITGVVPALPGDYNWELVADDGFHDPTRRSGSLEVGLPLVG